MKQIINPNPAEGQLTFTAIYADETQYNSSENGDYFDTVESIVDYMVKVYNNDSKIERIVALDFNGNIVALDVDGNILADTNKEYKMTRAEELKEIMIAVINGGYSEEDFNLFKAEYGWADWMSDYVEDEEITESESREIDEILAEGFKMAFDKTARELYLEKQLVDRKEKNMTKKTYYIEFYGTSGDGYVSYDNDRCASFDMAMTFGTEEEAIAECEKLQKEWKSELKVSSYSED